MVDCYVSAISVVDLARELRRYAVIDKDTICQLSKELADNVESLERGEDISFLAEKRYPENWLLKLWHYACNNTEVPDIGLRIGATVSPEAHGLLARWTFHSETLKDALQTYFDKVGLTNASEQWEIKYQSQEVKLVFSYPVDKNYPQCAVERSMIALHSMGEYLCATSIQLNKATFTFQRPAYAMLIQQQLQCPVEYSSQYNSLEFDTAVLNKPLPHRNQYMRSMIENRSNELGLLSGDSTLENKVRQLLVADIKYFSQIDNLAQKLHMSRTTLYRKLKKENTSFSEILDAVRLTLFKKNTHHPVTIIAELLGFNDMSTYYKSRNRWKSKGRLDT